MAGGQDDTLVWTMLPNPEGSAPTFERAERLARTLFGGLGSAIVLVNGERQWNRARPVRDLTPLMRRAIDAGGVMWTQRGSPPQLLVSAPIRAEGAVAGILWVTAAQVRPYDAELAAGLQDIADFVADESARIRAEAAGEAARAETERWRERLNLALEIAELYVWEADFANHTLAKAGPELTFYSQARTYEDFRGDLLRHVDPRDRAATEEAWRRHRETGEPFHPEYRILREDGREVWTSTTARTIADQTGRTTRMLFAMQNITERKRQEAALTQAKDEAEAATRAKSAFLATMSHEIRTPLNGVLGMVQAMAADALAPEQRQRLAVIRQSGASLLAILNDVLDISKIEAGRLQLELAEFDVGDVVRSAVAPFQLDAAAKGLDFELRISRAAAGVYLGDAGRVRQILFNLVSNALKFTEAGRVRVTVGRRAGGLVFTVSDTGIGLSADALGRVFRKFEQADISTTRRYGGTGLGLAICMELAEMMDGAITAESRPGEGAAFRVSLPLHRLAAGGRRPAPAPAAAAHAPDRPGLRVLAAEDNGINQLVLKTLLAQIGVDPVMTGDGREALEVWEQGGWDLILMDVQMPVMDGLTATALIRAQEQARGLARTPIVALTANVMTHQVAEYRRAGMDGFVAKPIDAASLFGAISAALENTMAAAAA